MSRPRFQTYQDKAGGWRWHLKAGNNEIVATGESHTTEDDARRAAARTVAIGFEALDLTLPEE